MREALSIIHIVEQHEQKTLQVEGLVGEAVLASLSSTPFY